MKELDHLRAKVSTVLALQQELTSMLRRCVTALNAAEGNDSRWWADVSEVRDEAEELLARIR